MIGTSASSLLSDLRSVPTEIQAVSDPDTAP
jgi:hypothetical protein